MLPLAPYLAAVQRRGSSSRATLPSLAREASAGSASAPPVVLSYADKRVSTSFSLAAIFGSLLSWGAKGRSSTFLHPFAPRTLLRFHATMDALTSAGHGATATAGGQCLPLSQPLRAAWQMGIRPGGGADVPLPKAPADLPVSCVTPSVHSVSNHPLPSRCAVWRFQIIGLTGGRVTRTRRTLAGRASWVSPLPSRLTTATGRIEFAVADSCQPLLRTGRSPPVAPHPASRRRSYHRLRGARPTSARTCTSRVQDTCKRTRTGTPARRNGRARVPVLVRL